MCSYYEGDRPISIGVILMCGVILLLTVSGCKMEPTYIPGESSTTPFTAHLVLDHVRTIVPEFTPESILNRPANLHVDSKGYFIWNEGRPPFHVFDAEGGFIRAFGPPGKGPGELGQSISLDIGPNGWFYVLDRSLGRVSVFTPDYEFSYSFPINTGHVAQISMDNQGNLLQLRESWWDGVRPAVVKHDTAGVLLAGWDEIPFSARVQVNLGGGGLDVDAQDNVYYGWTSDHRIWKTDSQGTLLAVFDNKPAPYKDPDIDRLEALDGKGSGALMRYFMREASRVRTLILVPEKQLLLQHIVTPESDRRVRIALEVWHTEGFKVATDVEVLTRPVYADPDFLYFVLNSDEENKNPEIHVYAYSLEKTEDVVAP